jgi:hypothetical protein
MAASKKQGGKAGQLSRRPKFHGRVVHTPPEAGEKIRDGDHLVISILELSFDNLPDSTRRNELLFTTRLSTKDEKGKWVSDGRTSGEILYVPDGSSLNVHDWVVYDGPVHRHLSLELEIVELENPQKKKKELTEAVSVLTESVGNLSIPIPDPVAAALEIVPAVYGAALAANGDDQVLKYFTSLYTEGLTETGAPPLVGGIHLFEKLGKPRGKKKEAPTYVTLKLRIQKVIAT